MKAPFVAREQKVLHEPAIPVVIDGIEAAHVGKTERRRPVWVKNVLAREDPRMVGIEPANETDERRACVRVGSHWRKRPDQIEAWQHKRAEELQRQQAEEAACEPEMPCC